MNKKVSYFKYLTFFYWLELVVILLFSALILFLSDSDGKWAVLIMVPFGLYIYWHSKKSWKSYLKNNE